MTTREIKIRLQKANEKVQKKLNTIEKKEKWIVSGKKDEYDIKYLKEDIVRLGREIKETKKTIEKYEKQLAGEMERDKILMELPEPLKQMQKELYERWNIFDTNCRDSLKKEYKELGYSKFIEKHKYSSYDFIRKTNEEIYKENERDAKFAVIDLYYRVNEITGTIIDWSNIRCSGGALNGTVTGKEGKAKIETIVAGGYNIQRLHNRVLVHSI